MRHDQHPASPSPLPTRRDFLLATLAASCSTSPSTSSTTPPLDAHDRALELLLAHGPRRSDGASARAANVVDALGALQRRDALPRWLADHRPDLPPAPPAGNILAPSTQRQRLGDHDAFADWEATFTEELAAQAWPQVVARWQGTLLPGLAGAFGDGLVRTAHAVHAIAERDTPLRRGELARALAWQATCFATWLGATHPGDGDVRQALATVPQLPMDTNAPDLAIRAASLAAVVEHADWHAAVARAGHADAATFHLALLDGAARQFVRHGHEAKEPFVHVLLVAAALHTLWPHLDEPARRHGVRHVWQFAAAVQSRCAHTPFREPTIAAAGWPEDVIDAAVAHGHPYAIEAVAACHQAWRAQPSPAFVAAARHALTLW